MAHNFNTAKEQVEFGEVIPDGTIATIQINIRPGGAGEGGWMKRSDNTGSTGLDAEFTVVDGPYTKRKFWKLFTMEGPNEGHAKAAEISESQIRGILESARGIRPDDESEAARAARVINSWGDLDGLRFVGKIGVEKGKNGYKDKNTLAIALTPDRQQYKRAEQVARPVTAAPAPQAAPQAAVTPASQAPRRPSWASLARSKTNGNAARRTRRLPLRARLSALMG